jgi:hypothetical protein
MDMQAGFDSRKYRRTIGMLPALALLGQNDTPVLERCLGVR